MGQTPFVAQLMCVAFNYPPKNWAFCNGQLLSISQNQALFALLGTTFGGDGRVSFALPNLSGRVPIHPGNGIVLGQIGGEANHTLTIAELPAHDHTLSGVSVNASTKIPVAHSLANTVNTLTIYGPLSSPKPMAMNALGNTGGGQPHSNQSPYLVMNWVIALIGVFPSQT